VRTVSARPSPKALARSFMTATRCGGRKVGTLATVVTVPSPCSTRPNTIASPSNDGTGAGPVVTRNSDRPRCKLLSESDSTNDTVPGRCRRRRHPARVLVQRTGELKRAGIELNLTASIDTCALTRFACRAKG
jgi:hypothetical protein